MYTCEFFLYTHFVYVYILSTVRVCVCALRNWLRTSYRCVRVLTYVCVQTFALVRRCGHLRTCGRGLPTDRPHLVECELHFWFVWLFFFFLRSSFRSFPARCLSDGIVESLRSSTGKWIAALCDVSVNVCQMRVHLKKGFAGRRCCTKSVLKWWPPVIFIIQSRTSFTENYVSNRWKLCALKVLKTLVISAMTKRRKKWKKIYLFVNS